MAFANGRAPASALATKACSKCGVEKLLSEYAKHPANGLRPECKPCQRALKADWRRRNPEKVRAWEKANRDRKRATTRAWKQENPERVAELEHRREARKLAGYVEDVSPLVLLERDDGVCGICGEDVDPLDFQVDHDLPLSRGGFHNYANTQVAHAVCNNRKGTRTMGELRV